MAYSDRQAGLSDLAKYGFTDLSGTMAKLDQLVSLVGDSGRAALASLGLAQSPDQALNSMLRLAELDRSTVKKLLKNPDSSNRLALVLGASNALTDFLCRHLEMLRHFERSEPTLPSAEQLRERLLASISNKSRDLTSSSDFWNSIRKSYREELLRIAIFDLTRENAQESLPAVAAALADLAGAAIEAGLETARHELSTSVEFGFFDAAEVNSTSLSVIAMGKCGARELNYISDVDVIFVAESNSQLIDNNRAVEIATKLATRMMRAMDGTATEPMLWQVDPNLRPEGKSGALVRTLESHVAYYDRWAQSWEFQALLKARPLAGDLDLGNRYVEALAPKVWASASRENFVESVQKMRERVMEFIPSNEVDQQLKLGPGGLRDIEFTVQLLQLVHGRADATIRHRDTIGALNALAAGGYVARVEALQFADHYRFLRLLEHRIQMADMRRTHLMPTSEVKLRALARSVSLKMNADQLLAKWLEVKTEVRALHQRIFYRPLLSAVSRLSDDSLELSSDQVIDRLKAIGFADAKGALAHIAALSTGISRRAAIQKQLLPVLLQWFAEGLEPDQALLAFRRLSEDLGESPWYLRMLRDSSGAAHRMTQVLSNSRLATNLFEKIPEAAAWFDRTDDLVPMSAHELETEIDALISRHDSLENAAQGIRNLRRRETLRIAMGAVLGELDLQQISTGISDLEAAYLNGILWAITDSNDLDISEEPLGQILDLAVIAMGRFGGEELGFGSDADVMFVYEPAVGVAIEVAQRVAERVIAEVKRLTTDQLLEFELDLDLRPEGKNGPNARSLESYAAYYERWSDTWESQALLRARPIAGSKELQAKFLDLINKYRYPAELKDSAVMEIRRIKARMETERLPQGADPRRHLKLGRGSLSDVEWLVQLMQLRFGNQHPEIRTPQTLKALDACVAAGLIEEHDARVLSEAWLIASRVRAASVLWGNKRTDVLPSDRKQLEGIARIMEYPPGGATMLEEDYLSRTRRARSVYERLFYAQL